MKFTVISVISDVSTLLKGDSVLKFEELINFSKIYSEQYHNDYKVLWANICDWSEIFSSGTCNYSFNVGSNIGPQKENCTYKGAGKLIVPLQD